MPLKRPSQNVSNPGNGHGHGNETARLKYDPRHATKLAPPEEAFDAFEEDIGVGAARKKEVIVAGYASDSSDDDEDGKNDLPELPDQEDERAREGDDDDDMFADSGRDQKKKKTRGNSQDDDDDESSAFNSILKSGIDKDASFMDIVDEDNALDDEDDDEDEVDEEVGALGRKHNAPKLDSFNVRAEMKEGEFDEQGNYIRRARDARDNQDDWLQDVSRRDIHDARVAAAARRAQDAQREDADARQDVSVAELLADLVTYLERGETLLEALARLGGHASQPVKRKDKKRAGKQGETGHKQAVERMTELANKLMAKSAIDVYDTEREGLCRIYKRETGVDLPIGHGKGDAVMKDDSDVAWEFVWDGAEDAINGPYDTETMKSWWHDGLLTTESSIARVRRVGEIVFVDANAHLFG